MPNFDVQVVSEAWKNEDDDPLGDPLSMTRRIVGAINLKLNGALAGRELSLRFADDSEVQALNLQFREQDKATNVLSFPATPVPGQDEAPLGDIILAHETVAIEALEQNKTFTNHSQHLILHGILHLLGYDHDTDEKAAQMETLEREVLASLDIDDPYKEVSGTQGSEAAHVS